MEQMFANLYLSLFPMTYYDHYKDPIMYYTYAVMFKFPRLVHQNTSPMTSSRGQDPSSEKWFGVVT